MKFKKIATVIAGAFLVGSTMGTAAAASYPDQILNKNVAVVYGTDGADATDMTAANAIQGALSSAASGLDMGTTVTGGESFALDKSSNHMNFGDALNKVYTTVDKEDMDFLADGTYDDGDVDEDYSQEITLGSLNMSQYADKDYNDDEPTVGWMFEKSNLVLNYTIDFDASITLLDMEETDMPLLGAEYYVLDTTNSSITLLDSADTTILGEGETVTIGGRTVSIEFIDENEVKLNVDGEVTDSMDQGETEELDDGTFIAVIDLTVQNYAEGVKKVEFSIGDGEITLTDGDEVRFGDDSDGDVDGLVVDLDVDGAGLIDGITLTWSADDGLFLAEGDPITMPGFGVIGLEFGGLDYPSDSEMISVDSGEVLTLVTGDLSLPVLSWNDTDVLQGEEDYPLVIAGGDVTFNAAGYANGTTPWFETSAPTNGSNIITNGLTLVEDQRFIVTSMDTDLTDTEMHYYEVSSIDVDGDNTFVVELEDLIGNDDITFDEDDMDEDVMDTTITLEGFLASTNETIYLSFSTPGTLAYNKVISETGLVVTLPVLNTTDIMFQEADDEGDLELGATFNASVSISENDKAYVSYEASDNEQEESNDKFVDVIQSALASIVKTDESGDEYDFEIEYFGEEVIAEVNVIAGGSTASEGEINAVAIADTAAAAGKNIVVVGGNCVNTVARTLLGLEGGEGCLEAFEAETGVGNGGVLIQSFDWEGDIALLVAGYSAADTTKAQNALADSDIDVSVGNKYILEDTTAADASLVAA